MAEWISVKDKLPKKNGRYLCLKESKLYTILSFAKKLERVDEYDFEGYNHPGFYDIDCEYGYYEIDSVTHWMTLPELPKEKGETK